MQSFRLLFLIVLSVATLSSCHISRKRNPTTTGPVVIVKDSKAGNHTGYKKGWTKNPNNPHHPRTTNPGHTKNGKAGNTVIIVNNTTTVKQAAPKGNPGKGGKPHNNGNKGGKGGKGNGKGK
jgi:hypothetical protein